MLLTGDWARKRPSRRHANPDLDRLHRRAMPSGRVRWLISATVARDLPRPTGTCASSLTGIGTVPCQARTAVKTTVSRGSPPIREPSRPDFVALSVDPARNTASPPKLQTRNLKRQANSGHRSPRTTHKAPSTEYGAPCPKPQTTTPKPQPQKPSTPEILLTYAPALSRNMTLGPGAGSRQPPGGQFPAVSFPSLGSRGSFAGSTTGGEFLEG